MLAAGRQVAEFAAQMSEPKLLELALATDATQGQVVHIDHFGNAITNISAQLAKNRGTVTVGGRTIALRRTYAEAGEGEFLALIGSSDLVEISINGGSAARQLGLKVGDSLRMGA
jgi:S-adenosylmethionine hydrolase